jgi:hypothetical protein
MESHTFPKEFSDLSYNDGESITLKMDDSPYFAIRVERELNNNHLDRKGFNDFNPISANGFAKITIDKPDYAVKMNLEYLKFLGFLVERGNTYYIHPHAKLLYDPKTGLFGGKNKDCKEFKKIMKIFVLPGQFWSIYYKWLLLKPDRIKYKTSLEENLIEIEEYYLNLVEEEEEHAS